MSHLFVDESLIDSFKEFRRKYKKCDRCGLCNYRTKVVLGRGEVPADILFIGEAPGNTEDIEGKPFIGQSGKLLELSINKITDELKKSGHTNIPSYYITNTVSCVPRDEEGTKFRQPSQSEVDKCSERFLEEITFVHPKKVIFLGRVPEKFLINQFPKGIYLYHPSYILRNGGEGSKAHDVFLAQLKRIYEDIMFEAFN